MKCFIIILHSLVLEMPVRTINTIATFEMCYSFRRSFAFADWHLVAFSLFDLEWFMFSSQSACLCAVVGFCSAIVIFITVCYYV